MNGALLQHVPRNLREDNSQNSLTHIHKPIWRYEGRKRITCAKSVNHVYSCEYMQSTYLAYLLLHRLQAMCVCVYCMCCACVARFDHTAQVFHYMQTWCMFVCMCIHVSVSLLPHSRSRSFFTEAVDIMLCFAFFFVSCRISQAAGSLIAWMNKGCVSVMILGMGLSTQCSCCQG